MHQLEWGKASNSGSVVKLTLDNSELLLKGLRVRRKGGGGQGEEEGGGGAGGGRAEREAVILSVAPLHPPLPCLPPQCCCLSFPPPPPNAQEDDQRLNEVFQDTTVTTAVLWPGVKSVGECGGVWKI